MNTTRRYLYAIEGLKLEGFEVRTIKNIVNELGEGCHPVVTDKTVQYLEAGYVVLCLLKALPDAPDEQRILNILLKLEG